MHTLFTEIARVLPTTKWKAINNHRIEVAREAKFIHKQNEPATAGVNKFRKRNARILSREARCRRNPTPATSPVASAPAISRRKRLRPRRSASEDRKPSLPADCCDSHTAASRARRPGEN